MMLLSEYNSDSEDEMPQSSSPAKDTKGVVRSSEPAQIEPPQKKACSETVPEKPDDPLKPGVALRPQLPLNPFDEVPGVPVAPRPQLPINPFDEAPVKPTELIKSQKPIEKSPVSLVPPQIWKKKPNEKAVDF